MTITHQANYRGKAYRMIAMWLASAGAVNDLFSVVSGSLNFKREGGCDRGQFVLEDLQITASVKDFYESAKLGSFRMTPPSRETLSPGEPPAIKIGDKLTIAVWLENVSPTVDAKDRVKLLYEGVITSVDVEWLPSWQVKVNTAGLWEKRYNKQNVVADEEVSIAAAGTWRRLIAALLQSVVEQAPIAPILEWRVHDDGSVNATVPPGVPAPHLPNLVGPEADMVKFDTAATLDLKNKKLSDVLDWINYSMGFAGGMPYGCWPGAGLLPTWGFLGPAYDVANVSLSLKYAEKTDEQDIINHLVFLYEDPGYKGHFKCIYQEERPESISQYGRHTCELEVPWDLGVISMTNMAVESAKIAKKFWANGVDIIHTKIEMTWQIDKVTEFVTARERFVVGMANQNIIGRRLADILKREYPISIAAEWGFKNPFTAFGGLPIQEVKYIYDSSANITVTATITPYALKSALLKLVKSDRLKRTPYGRDPLREELLGAPSYTTDGAGGMPSGNK